MIQLGQMNTYDFINVADVHSTDLNIAPYLSNLRFVMKLDDIKSTHTRQKYGLIGMFGDIGGIFEILIIILGFIVSPYN